MGNYPVTRGRSQSAPAILSPSAEKTKLQSLIKKQRNITQSQQITRQSSLDSRSKFAPTYPSSALAKPLQKRVASSVIQAKAILANPKGQVMNRDYLQDLVRAYEESLGGSNADYNAAILEAIQNVLEVHTTKVDPKILQNLSPEVADGLSGEQIKNLSKEDLGKLGEASLLAIYKKGVKLLESGPNKGDRGIGEQNSYIKILIPHRFSGTDLLENLTPHILNQRAPKLTKEQCTCLTPSQILSLQPTNLEHVLKTMGGKLTRAQRDALGAHLAKLPPDHILALSPAHAKLCLSRHILPQLSNLHKQALFPRLGLKEWKKLPLSTLKDMLPPLRDAKGQVWWTDGRINQLRTSLNALQVPTISRNQGERVSDDALSHLQTSLESLAKLCSPYPSTHVFFKAGDFSRDDIDQDSMSHITDFYTRLAICGGKNIFQTPASELVKIKTTDAQTTKDIGSTTLLAQHREDQLFPHVATVEKQYSFPSMVSDYLKPFQEQMSQKANTEQHALLGAALGRAEPEISYGIYQNVFLPEGHLDYRKPTDMAPAIFAKHLHRVFVEEGLPPLYTKENLQGHLYEVADSQHRGKASLANAKKNLENVVQHTDISVLQTLSPQEMCACIPYLTIAQERAIASFPKEITDLLDSAGEPPKRLRDLNLTRQEPKTLAPYSYLLDWAQINAILLPKDQDVFLSLLADKDSVARMKDEVLRAMVERTLGSNPRPEAIQAAISSLPKEVQTRIQVLFPT